MDGSEDYFSQFTEVRDYQCPTPVTADKEVFIGWSTQPDDAKNATLTIEKGTKKELKLYAQFVSIENLSITPDSWTLNSDASATSGKFIFRIAGIDPDFVELEFDELVSVGKIGDNVYCISGNSKENSTSVIKGTIGNLSFVIPITFRDMPNILTLPTAMKEIKAEAFMNNERINGVSISGNKLTEIGSGAFKNCTELYFIELPNSVTTIAEDAFEGSPNVQFYCEDNSYAAEYADAHGIPHSPKYEE